MKKVNKNLDANVVNDFGQEWKSYDQSNLKENELKQNFNQYFSIFPNEELTKDKVGFDLGCGSGRWAKQIAPKVKILNCIDPSKEAIKVAKKNLKNFNNINFFDNENYDNVLNENSQDFGYCLGVLHHTTQTNKGLNFCNKILKKNAPFLIYLYYSFDNRPLYYRLIWKISDLLRKIISKLPFKIKKIVTDIIASIVYLPLAKFSFLLDKININNHNIPLSDYKNKSFYTMRTDSLDRFGTKLEKRYSKLEIEKMLKANGFKNIIFSKKMPFWVATCRKI